MAVLTAPSLLSDRQAKAVTEPLSLAAQLIARVERPLPSLAMALLPATIADVHFLGSVIRLTVDVDGTMVALDTFNRPDQPPPPIGLASEISFAAADVILLSDA